MIELRKYQNEAVQAALSEFSKGITKTLLVMPTASGKTVCFAKIIEDFARRGIRSLVLAHRGELLTQAKDKIQKVCGLEVSLEKAENSAIGLSAPVAVGSVQTPCRVVVGSVQTPCRVVVGSVQTMCREDRLNKYPSDYFGLIVVDEAHHCMADSYQKVLQHFNKAKVLGVTATPDRADQKNLGNYFESKAYEYSMMKAVQEGYLCPIKAQLLPLKLDIKNVGISNGDYALGEVGNALEPYLEQIAVEMRKYCSQRKTVIFLPLIRISQRFRELLIKQGFRAAEVNGDSQDRDEVLKDFESGKYNALCNSMLLTEGWDCPSVDCVVMLRPTKVRSLYQQVVGRGMRLSPGKKDLLLLDFLWLTERHDLCKPSSLVSKDEEIAKRIDEKIALGDGVDLLEAEDDAEKDAVNQRESSLRIQLEIMRNRKKKLVDPLQYSFSIDAEDLVNYSPTFAWEMGPASEKQIEYLENHGISASQIQNAGMASMLIGKLKSRQQEGLSTPKQIRCLERYGFRKVGSWKYEEASNLIDRIAMNRWFVPRDINPATYRPRGGK